MLTALYLLPLPKTLTSADYSTVLYARDGELLGATISADEQWRFPPLAELPEKYKTAVMAFEDSRFYWHPGVDPVAIGRAALSNIEAGTVVSGGSTLTMQVARLLLGNSSRSLLQKMREAVLALQLELHYSKEDIFILYATHAPFGGNTTGLAAANWRYFGHSVEHMTWAEAALFAVLPNKPADIFPGKNRERLLERRNSLLRRLHEQGAISALDFKLASLESLPASARALPHSAPHLLASLKNDYPERHEFHSNVDGRIQHALNDLAARHSRRLGPEKVNNLAAVVIDQDKQEVLAYLGNHTFQNNPLYSPSVDIVQRPRSSGSLFKPFLFAGMLDKGLLLPDSLVLDVPSYYQGYSPENYDRHYRGVIPAREALSQSLNVPAVRLLQEYGVLNFKEDLQEAGITTLFRPAEAYGLSLILGGAETTLWEVSNSFARLARQAGDPSAAAMFPQRLQDEVIGTNEFPFSQGAAWLTLEALQEVNRPGVANAWREFSSSQAIAWKTGTSYGWRDAWAVGSNGRYTVGVWAGNANGEEGRDLTGTRAAAPLMLDVFNLLPRAQLPPKPHKALKPYRVCRGDGYLAAQGCDSKEALAPLDARFTKVSSYHQQLHLDPDSGLRVHGRCQSVARMENKSVFQLPPVAAYYYRQHNSSYAALPPWREDCVQSLAELDTSAAMALEYPAEGASLRIPVELSGALGRAVFKAKHLRDDATLFWHLDGEFLGDTRTLHEQAIAVNPGWHHLVLVDDQGQRLERWFRAL